MKIGIKELRAKISLLAEVKVEVLIEHRGKVIGRFTPEYMISGKCTLQSPKEAPSVHFEQPKCTLQEEAVIEQELTKCDRCKKGYEEKELKAHWEDGVEFRVCLFCLNPKKRVVKKVSVTNVKMNDKMKELLSLH